jgi:PPOX class probable F420-dependent enzyme
MKLDDLDKDIREYLEQHHAAAMVTLHPDGRPHVVRVGVALVDGKLWSSGIPSRVRTGHVRRDPRATLFVFDPANPWTWVTLEADVTILDGPDVPEQSRQLFQVMQEGMPKPPSAGTLYWNGKEETFDDFRRIMAEEQRLIYEFEVVKVYSGLTMPSA